MKGQREMIIFHHSFTDVEKLSDSLPFELDYFLSITRPRITPTLGAKAKRNLLSSYKRSNAWCWRQIWKIRVPRDVELTLLENRNKQEQNKIVEKKEPRKMENQRKIKRMKEERRDNEQWSFVILGLITQKHSLGLLIFSFGTPNPGLHYVL